MKTSFNGVSYKRLLTEGFFDSKEASTQRTQQKIYDSSLFDDISSCKDRANISHSDSRNFVAENIKKEKIFEYQDYTPNNLEELLAQDISIRKGEYPNDQQFLQDDNLIIFFKSLSEEHSKLGIDSSLLIGINSNNLPKKADDIRTYLKDENTVALLDKIYELDLANKHLTSIPPEIGNLTNLRKLFLENNQIQFIPFEICCLKALQILALNNNHILAIPPEIGNLLNLQYFNLIKNQLTWLPKEIGNLKNLRGLYLSGNKLTCLPGEIQYLQALKQLWLDHNQLTKLPYEIGKLENLLELKLSKNRLTHLPPSLRHLTALKDIDVSFNSHKVISSENVSFLPPQASLGMSVIQRIKYCCIRL